MTELNLHSGVTPEKLIKAGFRRQSENKDVYRMREKLYKDSIYLSVKIDLSREQDEQIEWHIIDGNTGLSYNTFYFTPNTCKDLVRDTVHKVFCEVINEPDKREVLYMKGDDYGDGNCKV